MPPSRRDRSDARVRAERGADSRVPAAALNPVLTQAGITFYSADHGMLCYFIKPRGLALKPESADWGSAVVAFTDQRSGLFQDQLIESARTAPIVEVSGVSLFIGDPFSLGNMAHVLFDHLYRYWLAKQQGLHFDHLILYNSSWPWIQHVVNHVLSVQENVIYASPSHAFACERLIVASNCFPGSTRLPGTPLMHPANNADPQYLMHLRDAFRRYQNQHTVPSASDGSALRRLFISRRLSEVRSFDNLADIEGVFQHHNYAVVHMADLSIHEQLMLMHGPTHLAGFHGAGLTNLVAAGDAVHLLEIFGLKGTKAYAKCAQALSVQYTEFRQHSCQSPLQLDTAQLSALLEEMDRGPGL